MLDNPLTDILTRLANSIDLPQNRAIWCKGWPDRAKNESAMTRIPATRVAKTTQIVTNRVRIIPSPTYDSQFRYKFYKLTTKYEVYHISAILFFWACVAGRSLALPGPPGQVAISRRSKMASTASIIQIRWSLEAYPIQPHLTRLLVRTNNSSANRFSSNSIAK